MTRLRTERLRSRHSTSYVAGLTDFALVQSVQTNFRAFAVTYSMGTMGFRGKGGGVSRGVNVTADLHTELRLRLCGAVLPHMTSSRTPGQLCSSSSSF